MNLASCLHRTFTRSLYHSRAYTSSSSSSPLSPNGQIYISNALNPFFNLTLEDWLFRHHPPASPLLLIYSNRPCVVVGRNQNPWKELNLAAARQANVTWLRRRSGGGTVFHDEGNTNYSIHTHRTAFDRHKTAEVVRRALLAMGLDTAHVNDRNDICLGKNKMSSAYKIVSNRAYHHGTMLISTQLDTLRHLLRVEGKEGMETKGVASVRSPVCNLRQASEAVTHESFVEHVIKEFRREYDLAEDTPIQHIDETPEMAGMEYFRKGIQELQSWEWSFGQTPEFTYNVETLFNWGPATAKIHSKHGIILDCEITSPKGKFEALAQGLQGQRYGFVEEHELELAGDADSKGVWEWLKSVMQQ